MRLRDSSNPYPTNLSLFLSSLYVLLYEYYYYFRMSLHLRILYLSCVLAVLSVLCTSQPVLSSFPSMYMFDIGY